MIYLHKILPLIISPLFAVIILILWGLIAQSKKIIFTGITVLIICSLPIFSEKLVAYLEKDYKLVSAETFQTADAIVVLSGMVRTIQAKDGIAYEWTEASDRIFAGIDLFKKKKAPFLIFTRGNLPWSIGKPEGEYLHDIAVSFGISKENILLTANVKNTEQEAEAVKKLLTINKPIILLITSAFHMPRAQKVFEAAGIRVMPFPVDFLSDQKKLTIIS